MNRFALSINPLSSRSPRRGYTLVEILIATTLSMMMLGAVIYLFGTVGASITQSRSILESAERIRAAQNRLQQDLEGLTATPMPPRKPESNEGYFEYIEGAMIQRSTGVSSIDYSGTPTIIQSIPLPVDTDKANAPDTSVGDVDDILMFTTRSPGKPFTGRFFGAATESNVAEVAWFVRGNTLYRRQLLVAPHLFLPKQASQFYTESDAPTVPAGMTPINPEALNFYSNNDISVRLITVAGIQRVAPNKLADLTRRECRFAHPAGVALFDARAWSYLGLPTAKETSDPTFIAGFWDTSQITSGSPNVMNKFYTQRPDLRNTISGTFYPMFDYWTSNPSARLSDSEIINATTGNPYQGPSVADDVILTNVIGFDVKVWDTGAGRYVDLGKSLGVELDNAVTFAGLGDSFNNPTDRARVYDTWSNTYDGTTASDGFDGGGLGGIVDDAGERAAVPPYLAPLRGIQVKIRIFEPDSRQIREVTIQQDFLPK